MPLSLNEIRTRAFAFAKEWESETREDAEAKTFWDQFFHVFGVARRRVASFEVPIKKAAGNDGFIDLLWKGTLLVEHKSRGRDLDRAKGQAFDYFVGLKDRDLPRYVIVSDFARIRLYDLDESGRPPFECTLAELPSEIGQFGFLSGYQAKTFAPEDPANIKAAERLGKLHDLLSDTGYGGHDLEVFLVRILFCLFADHTGIFEKGAFRELIEKRTAEDGSDLGLWLSRLFDVLNSDGKTRPKTLDEQLAAFRYVNGRLFQERLAFPDFNSAMRETLFECIALNWSRINPSIFGSLFQSILDKDKRRNLGAHYTTEKNILKVLQPLFLDDLRAEFEQVRRQRRQLQEFHKKLAGIRILDPACGCGNFLVVAYREIRLLEIEVLRELLKSETTRNLDVSSLLRVDVDQFYGIEIEEWPAQIAQVALWLVDHQINIAFSAEFGQYFVRLPLVKSPKIVNGNALRIDWGTVIEPRLLTYIVGNPIFRGHQYRNPEQVGDMKLVWGSEGKFHRLDYVCCWFRKSAEFMAKNPDVRAALVSTNSITQGEQVGALWGDLLPRKIHINFAHRSFQWESEARGRAAVHCVIIGFSRDASVPCTIFDYETYKSEPHAIGAKNINPYLVDGPTVLLPSRVQPLPGVPKLLQGSKPWDGGHLLFSSDTERADFVSSEPGAAKWIRPYVGTDELIAGKPRYCLWLKTIPPTDLTKLTHVKARLKLVAEARRRSPTPAVNLLADKPTLFAQDRQPSRRYLAVPEVSSEARRFIPVDFLAPDVIASNKLLTSTDAELYDFGLITSTMHMSWVRAVAGRLESRISYAPAVWNNFPRPSPSASQKKAIEKSAQGILDARSRFPSSSLGDLYDVSTMPPELVKAHEVHDRTVDAAYGKRRFASEVERLAFLFERYQAATAPLAPPAAPKTVRGARGTRASRKSRSVADVSKEAAEQT